MFLRLKAAVFYLEEKTALCKESDDEVSGFYLGACSQGKYGKLSINEHVSGHPSRQGVLNGFCQEQKEQVG